MISNQICWHLLYRCKHNMFICHASTAVSHSRYSVFTLSMRECVCMHLRSKVIAFIAFSHLSLEYMDMF